MKKIMVTIQRQKKNVDINFIRLLIAENPSWNRTKISVELCKRWCWQSPNGRLKDMSCRNLLLKLERSGHIVLPPRQRPSQNKFRNHCLTDIPHSTQKIKCELSSLLPLKIKIIAPDSPDKNLFHFFLASYHYLSYRNTAGENIKYMVLSYDDKPLACLVFACAAWKTQARDSYIGWNPQDRERNLSFITNNSRFLILPWVNVSCLASHILSKAAHRLNADWFKKYGHPIYLLETFVDRARFRGVCYKAANWILVGQTTGRTRNDQHGTIKEPVKDVYVYPLHKHYKSRLCDES